MANERGEGTIIYGVRSVCRLNLPILSVRIRQALGMGRSLLHGSWRRGNPFSTRVFEPALHKVEELDTVRMQPTGFFRILRGIRSHQDIRRARLVIATGLAWNGQVPGAVRPTSDSGGTWVRLVAGGRLRAQG